jgi:hypothetical protein
VAAHRYVEAPEDCEPLRRVALPLQQPHLRTMMMMMTKRMMVMTMLLMLMTMLLMILGIMLTVHRGRIARPPMCLLLRGARHSRRHAR